MGKSAVAPYNDDLARLELCDNLVHHISHVGDDGVANDGDLLQEVLPFRVERHDLVHRERKGEGKGRMRVDQRLRLRAPVNRSVDRQLRRRGGGGAVVALDAGLDEVKLREMAQLRAAAGDEQALAEAHAQIAPVGRDESSVEEVPAYFLKLSNKHQAFDAPSADGCQQWLALFKHSLSAPVKSGAV